MDLNKVPKFVVNLEKRTDRLENITKEMEYMDWNFELFKAIDKGCHVGCTLSHLSILEIAKERNYDSVMIIEDDCCFMPYSKNLIEKIKKETDDVDFGILNLSPTLNRPVNVSTKYPLFNDLTNLPEKETHHRDIFATNMIVYHKSIYEDVFLISGSTYEPPFYIAIDEFNFKYIISKKQSYSPILPIAPQIRSWSDVSQGEYNNFYGQTYNWNLYSKHKIPNQFLDETYIKELKNKKIHLDIPYDN